MTPKHQKPLWPSFGRTSRISVFPKAVESRGWQWIFKEIFTSKLWFDLRSMILGFESIVAIKLKKFPQSVIKPAIINHDCIENHFCQVRACNGQNNNPTFHLQESAQNSKRYRQTTISRKSNAGAARVRKRKNWHSLLQCMVEPPLSGHPDMCTQSTSKGPLVQNQ